MDPVEIAVLCSEVTEQVAEISHQWNILKAVDYVNVELVNSFSSLPREY